MGWFDKLFGNTEIQQRVRNLDKPTRPAPPVPTVKAPSWEISEPVKSIIRTLENDEWMFSLEHVYSGERLLSCVHEWYGNRMLVKHKRASPVWNTPEEYHHVGDWMTMYESHHVSKAAFKAFERRKEIVKQIRARVEKESFMNLVKEN